MKTNKCFTTELREIMDTHNYKNISVVANIEDGKLKIEYIAAIDNDGNEVYGTGLVD